MNGYAHASVKCGQGVTQHSTAHDGQESCQPLFLAHTPTPSTATAASPPRHPTTEYTIDRRTSNPPPPTHTHRAPPPPTQPPPTQPTTHPPHPPHGPASGPRAQPSAAVCCVGLAPPPGCHSLGWGGGLGHAPGSSGCSPGCPAGVQRGGGAGGLQRRLRGADGVRGDDCNQGPYITPSSSPHVLFCPRHLSASHPDGDPFLSHSVTHDRLYHPLTPR